MVKGGCPFFLPKIIVCKERSDELSSRVFKSRWMGISQGRFPGDRSIKQIQTELCVTLRPLGSFEPGGFERVSIIANRFSVRPSAARFFALVLRRGKSREVRALLLRKEVIQPQVPLRLPCYDFIPITGHTLGTRGHFGYNRLS